MPAATSKIQLPILFLMVTEFFLARPIWTQPAT